MPPRTPLPSAAGWRCPQCTLRSFSTSTQRQAVGPEHPRYIAIPEPPQQTVPDRPPVKGVLPVPRDVFAGTDKSKTDDEFIAQATQSPRRIKTPAKGSREEWKAKMSEIRKQNLREGVKSLRARQISEQRRISARSQANQERREELLHRPEREDERLTAPSNNLDLDALLSRKSVPDPNREARLQRKRDNIERIAKEKKEERLEALHTLYMNARDFIVTPQQLDAAVDKAFGTPEKPYKFASAHSFDLEPNVNSIWAQGRPPRVQDLLNRATGHQHSKTARDDSTYDPVSLSKDRMRRIAEALTGAKMEKEIRK